MNKHKALCFAFKRHGGYYAITRFTRVLPAERTVLHFAEKLLVLNITKGIFTEGYYYVMRYVYLPRKRRLLRECESARVYAVPN